MTSYYLLFGHCATGDSQCRLQILPGLAFCITVVIVNRQQSEQQNIAIKCCGNDLVSGQRSLRLWRTGIIER